MNIRKAVLQSLLLVCLVFGASALRSNAQTLITNPPPFGVFFLASETNSPPYPFDPYLGAFPVYEIDAGIYLIDDTQGGGAHNNGIDPPCDPCGEGEGGSTPPTPPLPTNGFYFVSTPYVTNGTGFAMTLNDSNMTSTAYEIYYTNALQGTSIWNSAWSRVATGAVGVTNFILPFSPTNGNGFFKAARYVDTDGDWDNDAYEALVLGTDPLKFNDADDDGLPDGYERANATDPAVRNSDTNGVDADYFTLYFELKHTSTKPYGNLMRGPGFRVWGDQNEQPNGGLWFFFEQMHDDIPLNIWTSGDNPRAEKEYGPFYHLPNPDTNFHKYLVKYDMRTFRLIVSNQTSELTNMVIWRDNMTEKLGTSGPGTLIVSNLSTTPITNASYSALPFPRRLRYHWEGVIGNTSQDLVGESVHSVFWPIKKMVSKGSNVFYTCGYNEPGWDVQRFHTNNFQVVNTNFSSSGVLQLQGSPFPNDMVLTNNVLYVRYTNNLDGSTFTASFNPDTCALITITNNTSFPGSVQPTNATLAIAVHPENANVVAVYYRVTDQVVVYTNGLTNFVIGIAGGYSNGPAILVPTNTVSFRQNVKLSGYHYDNEASNVCAALCFQSDGKLWVGDPLTSRMLRFDTVGLCDGWFMYNPHSYGAFADPNDPTRVFNHYVEFRVDYSKPAQTGWVLTNYWGKESTGGHPDIDRPDGPNAGLQYVTTLTNGTDVQTFALLYDPNSGKKRLAELTTNGLRLNSFTNFAGDAQLESDGATLFYEISTDASFKRRYITGWSGADPLFATQTVGSVSYTPNHPIDANYKTYKLGNSNVFVFHAEKNTSEATNFLGFHLGAVTNLNSTNLGTWRWTNSPTGPMNGRGSFDPDCNAPGGSTHTVLGTNVFYLYRGEFWQGDKQACQLFHYDTDGHFIGQFGNPKPVGVFNRPGGAGNMHHFSAVRVNGILYLYTPDEGNHGIQRWRVDE